MATVLPREPNKFQGLENLLLGLIQGNDKRSQRKSLLGNLTPDQQGAVQGLPLQALSNFVTQQATNQFLNPLQRSQNTLQHITTQQKTRIAQGQGTPEDFTSLRNLGGIPQARTPQKTKPPRTTKFSFDRPIEFEDEDGKIVQGVEDAQVFFTEGTEAEGADIIDRRKDIVPKGIFKNHADKFSGIDISSTFDPVTDVEIEAEIPRDEITEVMADMVRASIITKRNPIDELQKMFPQWRNISIKDSEGDPFRLQKVSPVPSRKEQNVLILQSISGQLDEETQAEIEQVIQLDDRVKLQKAVDALKKSFGRSRR